MENKNNSGVIFRNDKKTENSKAPDYKGKIKVLNQDFDIALWVRDSTKGKFFSVQLQEPYIKDKTELPANINSNTDLPF